MSEPLTVASLSHLERAAFIGAVGAVFEHSPWVMAEAWEKRPFTNRRAFYAALAEVLREADHELLLSLINAHPELAGKAAIRGDLTADSAKEQAAAGLNACTPDEFARIQYLNAAYRDKFGWPFIIAVKGLSRHDIMAEMTRRIEHAADDEFREALAQVLRIACFRLNDLIIGE